MARKKPRTATRSQSDDQRGVVGLRIIGGSLRGSKLQYSGELRTRPMKDRVREAVFNLLGTSVEGTLAIDLFAGTGALGLEAISRGAKRAIFVERHWPTSRLIADNAAAIGAGDRVEVVFGDAFTWSEAFEVPEKTPLTVFCSPPYDFYQERREAMLALISRWVELCSPAKKAGPLSYGGQVVVEADERFDFSTLPEPDAWDIRSYLPAVVGIFSPEAG